MKKSINAKKLKAIKALADRGIGGEKENAKRIYEELSRKKTEKPDTEEMKNAKMHINKKMTLMCEGRCWNEDTLKTMLRIRFKVSINQVDSIDIARDMYADLISLDYLVKGKKYTRKHDLIN